ncbi:hypothetical protein [Pseudodonghicola xiamenensis]|uniref:DUF4157 domain-containing protein n=1 Tax=Pseudodonghicola xiamenensis TaxID=337702 RepID=A0A8J3HBZ5_9RHOB|nr:hypothetical protein [Pseudodonghicola xiamenensis]GHG99973.1 hypothetical protein GCM10010961_36260 [Pseudodonghicola xiamenensis]
MLRAPLALLLIALLLVSGCGRRLSPQEIAFARTLQGDATDYARVRLVKGAPLAPITFQRKPRPRLTCRERIMPPETGEIVTAKPAAVTLFNHILFTRDWYLPDYLPRYPRLLYLSEAMLFAHEMTHVWQWQNRTETGYSPLGAAAEHRGTDDPYLFDLTGAPDFLSFGYEQQGAIMEEYVCCRALAPQAPRTKRLHAMLAGAMPVAPLPQSRQSDVILPWRGVELTGICS